MADEKHKVLDWMKIGGDKIKKDYRLGVGDEVSVEYRTSHRVKGRVNSYLDDGVYQVKLDDGELKNILGSKLELIRTASEDAEVQKAKDKSSLVEDNPKYLRTGIKVKINRGPNKGKIAEIAPRERGQPSSYQTIYFKEDGSFDHCLTSDLDSLEPTPEQPPKSSQALEVRAQDSSLGEDFYDVEADLPVVSRRGQTQSQAIQEYNLVQQGLPSQREFREQRRRFSGEERDKYLLNVFRRNDLEQRFRVDESQLASFRTDYQKAKGGEEQQANEKWKKQFQQYKKTLPWARRLNPLGKKKIRAEFEQKFPRKFVYSARVAYLENLVALGDAIKETIKQLKPKSEQLRNGRKEIQELVKKESDLEINLREESVRIEEDKLDVQRGQNVLGCLQNYDSLSEVEKGKLKEFIAVFSPNMQSIDNPRARETYISREFFPEFDSACGLAEERLRLIKVNSGTLDSITNQIAKKYESMRAISEVYNPGTELLTALFNQWSEMAAEKEALFAEKDLSILNQKVQAVLDSSRHSEFRMRVLTQEEKKDKKNPILAPTDADAFAIEVDSTIENIKRQLQMQIPVAIEASDETTKLIASSEQSSGIECPGMAIREGEKQNE